MASPLPLGVATPKESWLAEFRGRIHRNTPGYRSPRAYYGGQPVQPIPSRSGLQLPGQVEPPAPSRIPPEVTTKARSLPEQIGPERIYGPRPTPAQRLPSRSGLMLSGEVEPQAAALGRLPAAGTRSAAETGEALGQLPQRLIEKVRNAEEVTPALKNPRPDYYDTDEQAWQRYPQPGSGEDLPRRDRSKSRSEISTKRNSADA